MKFSIKTLFLIVFCAGIVGAVVYAFLPQPIAVDMATVDRGPLRVTVDEDGKTRIKERYVVSSPLSGRLLRIELEAGDEVRPGQTLIASIEPTNPDLLDARTLAQAEAKVNAAAAALNRAGPELERARVAMNFAESERKRITELFQRNAASQSDFENAELLHRTRGQEYKASKFSEEIARFELELARAALLRTSPKADDDMNVEQFEIHSPISGRVLRVFQESSTVLQAGAELVELGDPQDLEVEVDVLSKDAIKIKAGATVLLEQWGGDKPLAGTVTLVEPQAFTKISSLGVEEQRVNVIIDFLDAPQQRNTLGDGYRVEARIVTWEHANVLKAPTSSLFREGTEWAVFVVNHGRAKLQLVQIGHRSGLEAEVLKGLQPKDQVIMHPSDKIKPNVAVVSR